MMNFDNMLSLGETTGEIIKDFSRYGNNGTGYGGISWTGNGKRNGAYQFDGIDDYIGTDLYASETITISWRLKTSVDKIGFVNFGFRSGSTDAFEFLPQIRNGLFQFWGYSKTN
jgi:hypothetical protein